MSGWSDLKRILSGKALTASPEVVEALQQGNANFAMRLGGVNRQIAIQINAALNWGYWEFYKNSPAVRTVIDLIANNAAQLDLRLFEEVAPDETQEQPDHPAMYSLKYPNPNMSSDQFVRYAFKSFLLYENFFATKHRQNGTEKLQFVVLPPERMEVMGPGLTPTAYLIWNMDGSQSGPIAANDMLHWRGENFGDPRIGCSKLETLRAVIVEEAAMQAAIVELAKSGFASPTWIARPLEAPEMSMEGVARMEEHTANRLKQAGRIPPLMEEGMELKEFGFSPRDSEALAARKYALQQVASLYNVPLGMVGLADNVEDAQAEFYSDTLPTICEAFTRQLNLQVLEAEYGLTDYYFELSIDEKQMGNERLKALTSAAGVPPLLRNEARAKLNLGPVDGGDEPMTPANMMPGSDPEALLNSGQQENPPGSKPADNVMPIQNPAGPEQDGSAREGDQGVKPSASSIGEALRKFYERFGATKKDENLERWGRELAADLSKAGLNGDAELAAAQITETLRTSLGNGKRAEVLNKAKAEAPRVAARWEMRPEQMKSFGLPEEIIWKRLGYSDEEIDTMRALKLAESLASPSEIPSDH